MTTYRTGNPIGSTDPKDLYDNAENTDVFVNSLDREYWDDRFGRNRKTIHGMYQDFQEFLIKSGYVGLGPNGEIRDYEAGLEITERNQVFRYEGELYRAGAALELPYTTTGDWATEGSLFKAVGDASLRQEIANEDGSKMIGYGSNTVGGELDLLGESDAGSVLRYGAVGDGVTESGEALTDALAATGAVAFPRTDDGYKIQKSRTITLTRDSVIDFRGNEITFGDTARLVISSPVGVSGRTIIEDVQRGSGAVRLDSVADIDAGDLLYIETTVSPSTEWADTKKDCVRVKQILGEYVILEESLNFGYSSGDAGLQITTYKPYRLTIRNAHLIMSSDAIPRVLMEVRGCQDVILDGVVITGPAPFNPETNIYRVGVMLYRCFGVTVLQGNYTRMSYPVELDGGTRNVRASNIIANACRHTIEAADWSSSLTVDGLDASDCYSAVSAHPSFNVHFSNFSCRRETGLANLRTIGGSLKNGIIETLATDDAELPQFQSILMSPEYLYLYADADFDAHNVEWKAPYRTERPCFAVNFGRNVRISHLTMPVMGMSLTSRNNIDNLEIGEGMMINGRSSPSKLWVQNKTRIVRAPLTAPRIISGNPTIDLPFSIVDATEGYAETRGPVSIGLGSSPLNTTLILYLDTFTDVAAPDEIVGFLTLYGSVRHNATGRFSTRVKTWNFISSRSSPGVNSVFPLTPIEQSSPSGQSNENLSLDISNATFSTDSSGYQYVMVNISMNADGLASQRYGLSYELKLHRLL